MFLLIGQCCADLLLVPPRLRIAVIRTNGRVKYLALHNPSNNELLCCDFNRKTVMSMVVSL